MLHHKRVRLFFVISLIFATAPLCLAEESNFTDREPVAELSPIDAIILGVVEGVTEFLPISSTGHLIIATHYLGLEGEEPLLDASGKPLWHKKPSKKYPEGEPLTLKLAADTYIIVIQVGAILAVLLLYRAPILSMLQGLLGRDASGARLLRNVVLAFTPVAIIGLAASKIIEKHLFSVNMVIVGLVGGAILMIIVERWRHTHGDIHAYSKEPADLRPSEALTVGFMQCLALLPGTSRSMVTIVGGYLGGLTPVKAAEFSFLVGLPVLAGAALLKSWRSGPAMIEVLGWTHVLLGILVAAVSAAIAVKFFVSFLTKHGLLAFAIYRIVLAGLIALFFYL